MLATITEDGYGFIATIIATGETKESNSMYVLKQWLEGKGIPANKVSVQLSGRSY